jgi:hypothetical protein
MRRFFDARERFSNFEKNTKEKWYKPRLALVLKEISREGGRARALK